MMSEILAVAHEMAYALTKVGAMDEITMRRLDALCLPPKRQFGSEDIRRIRLTKPERLEGESKEEGKKRYLERLRQAHREAILLKLADRLSNVQFLETHPRLEFQRKYYRETLEYVLPLTEGFPRFQWWFQNWQETAGWRWGGKDESA